MAKEQIIIIALIVVIIYFHYQQNQPNISNNNHEVQELRNQVNYYQTLYQKRVEKDLGLEKKVSDLETTWLI